MNNLGICPAIRHDEHQLVMMDGRRIPVHEKGIAMNERGTEISGYFKELVDHGGNKQRGALKLGASVRTVNRCIAACKSKGKAAFVHGNRHRPLFLRFLA